MDRPGFEPGASPLRGERSAIELPALRLSANILFISQFFILLFYNILMLQELLRKSLEKKKEIKEKIEKAKELFDESLVKEKWIPFKFEEIDERLVAVDGSYNFKQYHSFVLYAISTISIRFDKKISKKSFVEIDIEKPSFNIEEKLKLKMTLAELELFYSELLNKKAIGIIDGSLIAELLRPFYVDVGELKKVEIKEKLKKTFAEKIGKEIFVSKKIEIDEKDFAEYYEYFFTLYLLLKSFPSQIIAISKTSSTTHIFNSIFSDLFLFENFTKEEGFSKPFYFSVNEKIKKGFEFFNEFFKSLTFTIFYIRLKDNMQVLKVEIPSKIDEEGIKKIGGILKRISIKGYPYLLKKAHNEAIIKSKHMDKIEKVLGIFEKSGREVLKL